MAACAGHGGRSRRSRRILVAYDFLKNISLDGTPKISRKVIKDCKDHTVSPPEVVNDEEDDQDEIAELISNISFNTARKVDLHHSVSITCAGNVEEDIKQQRGPPVKGDYFGPTHVSHRLASRSKSLVDTTSNHKDSRIIQLNSPLLFRQSQRYLEGRR